MSNKTKVTIEHPDGVRKEITADTVICFTVDDVKEFLTGQEKAIKASSVFMGKDIPVPIFPETIGTLLASFIEHRQRNGNPALIIFDLHAVAEILERRSKDIVNETGLDQLQDALKETVGDLLKTIFKS